MIEAFTTLIKSKRKLRNIQKVFKEKLKGTYPNLVNGDTKEVLGEIGDELEILLSSSVLFKTGRFKIPADTGWKKEVILTRIPGLKRPYESYPAIDLNDVTKITPKGNLIIENGNKKTIKLGILKNHPKIKQDKLEVFYSLLKELFPIREKVLGFVQYDYYDEDNAPNSIVKGHKIRILNKGFQIEIKEGEKDYSSWSSDEMYDYDSGDSDWGGKSSLESQESLLLCLPAIHKELKKFDAQKAEGIRDLTKLLDKIKIETKPFKVLQKLSQ